MVRYRKTNKYFYLVLVAFLLLVFLYFDIFSIILVYLISPFQRKMTDSSQTINQIILDRRKYQNLEVQNKLLENRLTKLLIDNAKLQILEEENKVLRKKIGFLFQNPDDQLFAPTVWEDVAFVLEYFDKDFSKCCLFLPYL